MPLATSQKIQVLIVDDSLDMLDIYKAMFEGEGRFVIDLMSDVVEALRKLDTKHYDLIVLDSVIMPHTCESFVVYLRGHMKMMDLPVIVVTALDVHTLNVITGLAHVSILQKPIRKEDLFKAIDESLQRSELHPVSGAL